jgi:hypothetical protein
MSDVEEFLLGISTALVGALEPIPRIARSPTEFDAVLADLGWTSPLGANLSPVRAAFDIGSDLESIKESLGSSDLSDLAADPVKTAQIVGAIVQAFTKVEALTTPPLAVANVPAPFNSSAFWSSFPLDLTQLLLVTTIERQRPAVAALLGFIGAIEDVDVPAAAPRGPYRRRAISLTKLAGFISNPGTHLADEMGWGDGRTLQHDRLLRRIRGLLSLIGPFGLGPPREGLASQYWTQSAPVRPSLRELSGTMVVSYDAAQQVLTSFTASALPIPAKGTQTGSPAGLTLEVRGDGSGAFPATVNIGPLALTVQGRFQAQGGLRLDVRPSSIDAVIVGPTGSLDGSLTLRRDRSLVLLGSPDASRVEVGELEAAVGASGLPSNLEIFTSLALRRLAFVLQLASADSFVRQFLGSEPQSISADVELGWSSKSGFHLWAEGGFKLTFGAHLSLALVRIETITLQARAGTGKPITVDLTVDGALTLGPVSASLAQIGIRMAVKSRSTTQPGNFGALDVAFGFKPPDGLGILIDVGPVAGGGFIFFDAEKGRYAGVMHLSLAGVITITAIGLLDTKLPGGMQGYSFLVIIAAEFPPIQLGMGFTLSGVGGLAGIHRTTVTEALQAGVRSGSVDHILFPEDPIRDAPQIISDLSAIFPPVQGRYVFGPMAILAYGSGPATLLEAELGIILEVPAPVRLVLLGQLHGFLPSKDAPVVELHLDVAGVVEFAKKELAIDAVLHDSRLATYPLFGDMALRLSWADPPVFAMAIGGFNPRFQPPPGFPALRRITLIVAAEGGNPELVLQSYFALTSNTVQLGCRGDLNANAMGFTITGWLGFDVLAEISPFSLVADFTANVAVRKGPFKLASVALEATMTGPAPWHLLGQATFDFIKPITVPIDATIGEARQAELPSTDPWALLSPALEDPRNWRPTAPAPSLHVVTIRQPKHGEVLFEPIGGAEVHQKVVPLNRRITKFGEAPPSGAFDRFTVNTVRVGQGQPGTPSFVTDFFAPAQFEQMSDADKLSRPAFERMDAGVVVASTAVAIGTRAIGENATFQTIIVDDPDAEPDPYVMPEKRVLAGAAMSAAAQGPLQSMGTERFAPPWAQESPAKLADEEYVVVRSDTLFPPAAGPMAQRTKGAAEAEMADFFASEDNRAQRGRLIVVPKYEAAA